MSECSKILGSKIVLKQSYIFIKVKLTGQFQRYFAEDKRSLISTNNNFHFELLSLWTNNPLICLQANLQSSAS